MQKVIFNINPTPNPDEEINHQFNVVNPDHGVCIPELIEAIEKHLPVSKNDGRGTVTTKTIIRVDRSECPCCHNWVQALVQVNVGTIVFPDDEISAYGLLYRVTLGPDWDCDYALGREFAKIELLTPTVVARHPRPERLPRKQPLKIN